jgi:hypothetical protein
MRLLLHLTYLSEWTVKPETMAGTRILFFVLWVIWRSATVVSAAEPPPKEPVTQKKIFARLLQNTRILVNSSFGKSEPGVADNLQSIWTTASSLEEFAEPVPDIPSEYLLGLAIDAWQINTVVEGISGKGTPEPLRWAELIKDVADDLRAKIHFAEPHLGDINPSDAFGNVTVQVTTRDKEAKEVSNYEVWYCLKGLVNYKDRYDHFDNLSSPTSRPIPPGNYMMWTRKDSKDGPLEPANDIGSDGQSRRSIDLPTY